MSDLTVIYYTDNRVTSKLFYEARKVLLEAAKDFPLISVTQKPLDFGQNICIGDIGRSHLNIYRQMLIGAKAAKTDFLGFAEDDTLYSHQHFKDFRPKPDEFAYNMSRWSLFTWVEPAVYSWLNRYTNSSLIAPRKLFIEAMEERFNKYSDESKFKLKFWAEPGRYEKHLHVTVRKIVEYFSCPPIIVFTHPECMGYLLQGEKKRLGKIRAYDIPYWGKAEEVIKKYWKQ